MNKFKIPVIISLAFSFFVLAGCNTEEDKRIVSDDLDNNITKISKTSQVDQSLSNDAKEFVLNKDNVTGVRGVNTATRLFIAVEIAQLEQFNEQDIGKEIKKELQKKYSNKKVEVSSDQKLFFELDELEKQVQNNNIKREKLTKKFDELEKLLNDEA
ncbi:hypothetical protein [Aquibacillus saliphilus]|uniref:hypothetical protein n=1 Tax=Aquibacillus saliphilus TaxID=1909422 RepID=UPI001CF07729|nr:hypothetical protein [Aquibacillus saliphilus]